MITQNNKNIASNTRTCDKKFQSKTASSRTNEKIACESTKFIKLNPLLFK